MSSSDPVRNQNHLKSRCNCHSPTRVYTGVSMQDVVRRSTLGVAAYIALEGGMFRTVFPSSSISLGAYANTRSTMRSSIISNSAIASEAQRKRIQEMGRRFGCHQCGNRQLLSRKTFIADHMPPTKRAEELSAVWWRKILKIKVKERCTANKSMCLLTTFTCTYRTGGAALMASVPKLLLCTGCSSSNMVAFAHISFRV